MTVDVFDADQRQPFRRKKNTPAEKYGGTNAMVWSCFAASGNGKFAAIESTMNSASYQKVLEENVQPES